MMNKVQHTTMYSANLIKLCLVLSIMSLMMISTIHAGSMIPITETNRVLKLTKHKSSYNDYVDVVIDKKVKQLLVNTTFIRYTVPLQVTKHKHIANMILDTTSSFVYMYCCKSPIVEEPSLCIRSAQCHPLVCEKDCPEIFRDKQYIPVLNNFETQKVKPTPTKKESNIITDKIPYFLEVHRQVNDDYYPSEIGFPIYDPHRNDTNTTDPIAPPPIEPNCTESGANCTQEAFSRKLSSAEETDLKIDTVYASSPYYKGSDGFLGLAYSAFDFSFQQYLLNSFTAKQDQLFALDFFTHEQRVLLEYEHSIVTEQGDALFEYTYHQNESSIGDGRLVVGPAVHDYIKNYSSILGSGIQWSERQYAVNSVVENRYQNQKNRYSSPIQHAFPIYDLSLCGNSLFSNYSGNWHAIISTDVVGLGLPTQYYRMVIEWLKKTNNTKSFSEWTKQERYSLPDLTFRLHQDDSRWLSIPLHTLIEDNQFHLYDAEEAFVLDGLGVLSTEPFIQLGVKVIQHLFTVFDYAHYRVGFIQKKFDSDESLIMSQQLRDAFCKKADASETCIGDQTYYGPMNTCLQPQCELYMFQSVDARTGKCRLSISFYALFIFIIGLCLLSEIALYEVYHRVIQALYSRAAANNATLNNGIAA